MMVPKLHPTLSKQYLEQSIDKRQVRNNYSPSSDYNKHRHRRTVSSSKFSTSKLLFTEWITDLCNSFKHDITERTSLVIIIKIKESWIPSWFFTQKISMQLLSQKVQTEPEPSLLWHGALETTYPSPGNLLPQVALWGLGTLPLSIQ